MSSTPPLRWTLLLGVLSTVMLAGAGCAGQVPDSGDPPSKIKVPPTPKDGSNTTPNCQGIPEAGTCEEGVAVYCDVATDSLRRKDCMALGKSCLVDGTRGAICDVVPPPDPGTPSTACVTGVSYAGTCGGADGKTAVWCDTGTGHTISWDCSMSVTPMTCEVDKCASGAFCCATAPPPPPPVDECPALGFAGVCGGPDNQTARYCNGTTLVELPCSGDKTCQVDACATGAYCCAPAMSECDTIGSDGICSNGMPRWCSGGTIEEVPCTDGKTCQIDVCGSGAFCCDPT